jgi:hypothetical protein
MMDEQVSSYGCQALLAVELYAEGYNPYEADDCAAM